MTDERPMTAAPAGSTTPLGHVSDDPGRPTYTIDGAPGAPSIV